MPEKQIPLSGTQSIWLNSLFQQTLQATKTAMTLETQGVSLCPQRVYNLSNGFNTIFWNSQGVFMKWSPLQNQTLVVGRLGLQDVDGLWGSWAAMTTPEVLALLTHLSPLGLLLLVAVGSNSMLQGMGNGN